MPAGCSAKGSCQQVVSYVLFPWYSVNKLGAAGDMGGLGELFCSYFVCTKCIKYKI